MEEERVDWEMQNAIYEDEASSRRKINFEKEICKFCEKYRVTQSN